jgi:hypothetical protein
MERRGERRRFPQELFRWNPGYEAQLHNPWLRTAPDSVFERIQKHI